MDHASGIHQHATKRQLYSWKPAKYYVPHHLNGPLKCIGHQLHKMAGTPEELKNLDIIPVEVGDAITLSNGYLMKPFPTHHRVPSQGYLLYKQFQNKSSQGMASLENVGAGLLQSENIPEVAYTGDTTFDAFLDPLNPDLLKVKLLIMEATYLENNIRTSVEKARERGHTHLFEIIQHEHLFRAVKSIVLIHFSDRYTSKTVRRIIHKNLPQSLQEKVHLATMALETR